MQWANNNRKLTFGIAAVLLAALLVSWRVSVWQRQVRLNHALIRAVNKDDTATAERLLDTGADPNTRDGYRAPAAWPVRVWDKLRHRQPPPAILGYPVLITAVDHENVALVQALVAHKANVNAIGDEDVDPQNATTAIVDDEAAKAPLLPANTAIAKVLLKAGANLNPPGWPNESLLFSGVFDPENTKVLIDAGTDVNCRDDYNQTPLIARVFVQQAYDGQQSDTLAEYQELLAAGADINAQDRDGHTALMYASQNGLTQVVKFLLAHGARTDFRGTDDGKDALELAKGQRNKAIVALLDQANKRFYVVNDEARKALRAKRAPHARHFVRQPSSSVGRLARSASKPRRSRRGNGTE